MTQKEGTTIGVLGGGQLGKMLFEAGSPLNTKYMFLEKSVDCPAALVCQNQLVGSLQDADKIAELARDVDVLTFEIEHVNTSALQNAENLGVTVIPKPAVLTIIQDKGLQKDFYTENNVPTLPYSLCTTDNIKEVVEHWPEEQFVLKHRKGGYDGKGVQLLTKTTFLKLEAANDNSLNSVDGYVVEKQTVNATEVSVIVAIGQDGSETTFPTCEMVFDPRSNLMDYLISPTSLSSDINIKCEEVAIKAVRGFNSPGLFAVELFVDGNNDIYVNEIAPRPHNSGHHTIEANYTSQYEMLNHILLNQPLGSTALIKPAATCNIVGPMDFSGDYFLDNDNEALAIEGVYIHLYGKKTTSPDRKLGHFTVLADSRNEVIEKMKTVKDLLKIKST